MALMAKLGIKALIPEGYDAEACQAKPESDKNTGEKAEQQAVA